MDRKITSIKERVMQIAEYKGIAKKTFCEKIGLTYSSFRGNNKKTSLNSDAIVKILTLFQDISSDWLLKGEGEMLKSTCCTSSKNITEESIKNKVPFWNLPVSAGKSVDDLTGAIQPDSFLSGLPGIDEAEHALPVVGSSMEPEIPNGSIIGIKSLSGFDSLNTQRIYLIITREDRMIKRIEHDPSNSEILWCISPNYPRFSINKEDIIEIHVVCFVYEPQ